MRTRYLISLAGLLLLVACSDGTTSSPISVASLPPVGVPPITAGGPVEASTPTPDEPIDTTTPTQSGGDADDDDGGDDRGDVIVVEGLEVNNHGTEPIAGEAEDDGSVDLELDTDGEEHYFSPSILVGASGERRVLHLVNEARVPHNFTYGTQSIDVDPGQTETIIVRLPKRGTMTFSCRFHVTQGMAGAFRVA